MKGVISLAEFAEKTGKDTGVITFQVDRYLDNESGELSFMKIASDTSGRVFKVLSGGLEIGTYTVGVTPVAGGVPQAVFTPASRYAEAA